MRCAGWSVVLMTVVVVNALAGVGEWKTYTAKRNVRDLTVDSRNSNLVWVATGGGMFSYNFSDNSFAEYTTSEGLRTIDLTAITSDNGGILWVGAANGFLHRFDPIHNDWQYVSDIALLPIPNKRINRLEAIGDTLFILSDIGVSVFSISRMEFISTYSRFGPPSAPQIVGNATSVNIFNGKLWVGTRRGLASTPVSNPNPSSPDSWQVYTTASGLPSNVISQIKVLNDTVYVGTTSGVAFFNGVTWNTVAGTSGLGILDMELDLDEPRSNPNYPTNITFLTGARIGRIFCSCEPALFQSIPFPSPPSMLAISPRDALGFAAGAILTGTQSDGFLIINRGDTTYLAKAPRGPYSNRFIGLAVDQRGVVWSGTGTRDADGFMSYNGSEWRSYTVQQYPELRSNDYYKISIGKDNAKWVSNWGVGVVLLDDGGSIRRVFSTTSGLPPSVGTNSFVVVGGVATDRNGVGWITNRTGLNDTALTKFGADSSLNYVGGIRTRNPDRVFTDIVIDNNGTKWLANFSRFEPAQPDGFYFYNDRFTLPGAVNGWGRLSTSDGLTSDKVYSVAVDKDGELWIGSDLGISIIFNPAVPRSIAIYHPLRDQVIQAIVVDAVNNKWVATRQGVFVLSSDGTSILDRYSVENTQGKLLDDDVASLAIDNNTGTVYFGTEKGLSSLTTAAITPGRAFDELKFAPNPVYLPSPIALSIDGLVANSIVKILSVDGNIVREIRTPGGRIGFWDGRNEKGELVATGVYLVVAYSEDGTKVATGKVAVVRR